jgi:hypothetical protein
MPRNTIEDLRSEFADSKYVFVHQADNWADEMDVNGYAVFKKAEFLEFLDSLEKVNYPVERFFGTNEYEECDLEDYLQTLNPKEIALGEYKAFITMFERTQTDDFWIPEPDEDYDYDEGDEEWDSEED